MDRAYTLQTRKNVLRAAEQYKRSQNGCGWKAALPNPPAKAVSPRTSSTGSHSDELLICPEEETAQPLWQL